MEPLEGDQFKSIRHRFYRLGKKRCAQILADLGKCEEDEPLSHDEMKVLLEDLNAEARIFDLIQAVEHHEGEVKKEKEEKEAAL